ncbi:hypothetical protein AVEN_167980-1 [Araneus ventricosus]|uniref:Uncharacterized protein n=1 Tax=Araneus ventricosus TaxID=182803 RepID=A0A4Y2PQU0_ARAVE|nr:hypothetical protein AVEN_167980-1 [Araneus ventricosus]
MEEGNLRRFVFVSQELRSGGHVTASPITPSTHNSPTSDLPPVSSVILNSAEESKPLYQALKPSVLLDTNFNKSLSEMLSVLENWARRGLDNAFNRPVKVSAVDIGTNLEKDLKYGLDVMKQMSNRIDTLMRAANKLPDPDTILLRGFERGRNPIRGDLIGTAFTVWHTIDDIELQVSHVYEKLKLFCENVSKKSMEAVNCPEQGENIDILITNSYTLVTDRLLLLRKQMEDFREKIRVFCSEIDEIL